MPDMETLRQTPDSGETSVHVAYQPPTIVSVGRLEDLTRGLGGKGGDAVIQKSRL